MTHASRPYRAPFAPIRLKAALSECGISQGELAERLRRRLGCPLSRPTVNLLVNKGYAAPTLPGLKAAVEAELSGDAVAAAWLSARELAPADVWQPLGPGNDRRLAMPADQGRRVSRAMATRGPALTPGDPLFLSPHEVEMLTQETLKHFKLFRNPFIDDVQSERDVFLSDEHRYIEAAMLDAARHGGFLAVIGEVGSGKSVMRRKVIEQLKRDGATLVVYPQIIDKTRLTAGSICDAIVQDVSAETCRSKLEDKTRQVQRLLLDRAKSGFRACLIIEEAHDLNVMTLKYLKRFYELEDGYRKLLGIILVGQSEMKNRLSEQGNSEMREVIRRVQVAEIGPLNGNLRDYLALKFRRLNKDVADVFADDAFAALGGRLIERAENGRQKLSRAYPLEVNNYAARAMNLARELGEPRVTADVVEAV